MEKLLMGLGLGFALLLGIAILVAVWEQLRDSARLRRLREPTRAPARAWQAPSLDLELLECAAAQPKPGLSASTPVDKTATPMPAATSAERRIARPATGQPSSGWTETEPMVLGGPSKAHFDPTEMSLH